MPILSKESPAEKPANELFVLVSDTHRDNPCFYGVFSSNQKAKDHAKKIPHGTIIYRVNLDFGFDHVEGFGFHKDLAIEHPSEWDYTAETKTFTL